MKSIALLIFLVPLASVAQDRIEGLVEIPALHGRVNSGTLDRATGPVPLFAEPSDESEVSIIVRDRRELESREHDYEQMSAVVYSHVWTSNSSWYQLRYIGENEPVFGWLNRWNAGDYRTVSDLVSTGLTFFTDDWDRRIFELPSQDSPARSFEGLELRDRPSMRVADISYQNDEPWYLVVLMRGSVCGGGGTEILGTGWVPAYTESGATTVWYYSRGC